MHDRRSYIEYLKKNKGPFIKYVTQHGGNEGRMLAKAREDVELLKCDF